jgi:hypothetical protein
MYILQGIGLGLAAAFLLGFLFGLYQVFGSGLFSESPATSLVYAVVVGAYGLAVLGGPAALVGAGVGVGLHRRRLAREGEERTKDRE